MCSLTVTWFTHRNEKMPKGGTKTMGPRAILDSRSQSRDARAMTQARRLAAIMVIDVVGYSRPMG
jgi:hypothetical protein